ncbi:hypothetical protein ACWC9H_27255 [Streptomyces sp. NPDC001251]
MAGRRGAQQRGRTDAIQPGKTVTPKVPLSADDPVRPLYEQLVATMQVSGSEILREGIKALHAQRFGKRHQALREAS